MHLVVRKLHEGPRNPFLAVLLLLHLENELIELLLERFIRVVDAQLLEADWPKVPPHHGKEKKHVTSSGRGALR